MKVKFRNSSLHDWIEVYIDDKLIVQGHKLRQIDIEEVLRALGVEVEVEEYEVDEDGFPL